MNTNFWQMKSLINFLQVLLKLVDTGYIFDPQNQAKIQEKIMLLCSYTNTINIRTRLQKSNDGLSGVKIETRNI